LVSHLEVAAQHTCPELHAVSLKHVHTLLLPEWRHHSPGRQGLESHEQIPEAHVPWELDDFVHWLFWLQAHALFTHTLPPLPPSWLQSLAHAPQFCWESVRFDSQPLSLFWGLGWLQFPQPGSHVDWHNPAVHVR